MNPFIIAPAGSNMSYIEGVLRGIKITPGRFAGLSYHHLGVVNRTSDLNHKPINDQCIKVYFEKFRELLILNWHYKLRLFVDPDDRHHLQFGPEWELSQKEDWKYYGDKWEIRAVVRWLYTIYNDSKFGEKIKPPGRNFNGCALYEGFEQIKNEFANFDVDYTNEQYQHWKDSQKNIMEVWKNMDVPNFVNNFEYDFEKGVYIGLQGIRNKITEDEAWEKHKSKLN